MNCFVYSNCERFLSNSGCRSRSNSRASTDVWQPFCADGSDKQVVAGTQTRKGGIEIRKEENGILKGGGLETKMGETKKEESEARKTKSTKEGNELLCVMLQYIFVGTVSQYFCS